MIDESQNLYYITYAIISGLLGIAYLKFQSSSQSFTIITTKEFKQFQTSFLLGYSLIILCELIANASFYHTLIDLGLSLEQITKLYLVTLFSTTFTSVAADVIDIGSKKDKCILSAILYSIAMFSLLFGSPGHYEMLLMGRIVYGAASSLQHSSFEAYAVQQHTSLGFPDDWLTQTFSFLTHIMSITACLSGVFGQMTSSIGGPRGCPAFCSFVFILTAGYLAISWDKDATHSPRFLLAGFASNFSSTVTAIRANKQMLLLVLVSSLCETSITIFTFYWAPWITAMVREEDHHLPYEIIFSTFIIASMLGNYLFQLYSNSASVSIGNAFQSILIGSSVSYFLGAIFQTPMLAFLVSIFIQLAMGGYWPSIGYFRGKIVLPELRNTTLTIPKVLTLILTTTVLSLIHHSPFLMLTTCATLNGAAAYIQVTYMDSKFTSIEADVDDDDDDF